MTGAAAVTLEFLVRPRRCAARSAASICGPACAERAAVGEADPLPSFASLDRVSLLRA